MLKSGCGSGTTVSGILPFKSHLFFLFVYLYHTITSINSKLDFDSKVTFRHLADLDLLTFLSKPHSISLSNRELDITQTPSLSHTPSPYPTNTTSTTNSSQQGMLIFIISHRRDSGNTERTVTVTTC